MSDVRDFLSSNMTSLGVHGVVNVKMQMQRFGPNHVQLKLVIERNDNQAPLEVTCFAPAGDPPTWEYLGEWIHPSLEQKPEGE